MPPTDTACTLFNVFDLGLPDQGAVGGRATVLDALDGPAPNEFRRVRFVI